MKRGVTRRAVLAATASLGTSRALLGWQIGSRKVPGGKAKPLPSLGEFVRFIDPVTENPVVRLTNPAAASFLPSATNRFVSAKEHFLVFSSKRTGQTTPLQLDLRTAAMKPLLPTGDLAPRSLSLDVHERFLYLLDGTTLKRLGLGSKKSETLSEDVSAFSLGNGPTGPIVVRTGKLELLDGGAPLAENVGAWCLMRPNGTGCVWGRQIAEDEQEFWYSSLEGGSGAGKRPALLVKGRVSSPVWAPDSRSLLYLRDVPGQNALLSEIHEVVPETRAINRISATSQFAAFSPNGDGSVFVGASRSKAQPTLILLLRAVQREFTLCEHRASHPSLVSPVFSPDSRRVYFQSDFQGQSALYSVNVELLVEPTGTSGVG